jgi:hypothetical protein
MTTTYTIEIGERYGQGRSGVLRRLYREVTEYLGGSSLGLAEQAAVEAARSANGAIEYVSVTDEGGRHVRESESRILEAARR